MGRPAAADAAAGTAGEGRLMTFVSSKPQFAFQDRIGEAGGEATISAGCDLRMGRSGRTKTNSNIVKEAR